MTPLSRLMALFPTVTILSWITAALWLVFSPSIVSLAWLLWCLYGWPVTAYRLHNWRYPLKEGSSHLLGDDYNSWWGGNQIQLVYIAFPSVEMVLRVIPGAYSAWLRLWGSSVGANVYWTPQTEVLDRGLVDIGDGVIIGHRVGFYSHLIKPTRKNMLLYAKRITIGDGAFIGADTALTPGVVIAPGAVVPMGSRLTPREKFG